MTGLELIALANSLLALGQKVIAENRDATEEEVEASFASRREARDKAYAALRRAEEREAGGG